MTLVQGLEVFTVLSVALSSLFVLLAAFDNPLLARDKAVRLGAWGLGLSGMIGVTGGLGGGESALIFGGLCLICLAIGMEAPRTDLL